MVDKNLFLHDLAIVAILKNEAPYLKEWLDYHLLAGVDHFYLYDNDSPDNQAEIAAPYVEAGLVDYFSCQGKAMQMVAYNDAVKRFKFFCRYMTFIDGDEFVYPKLTKVDGGGCSISEVVDKILSRDPKAAGLEISWQIFGSNGQEKADYSRGVLERFTRRAVNDLKSEPACKTIFNARRVRFISSPHCANYFQGFYAVNSNNETQRNPGSISPPITDKIVINHYHCKSWEEYQIKHRRGYAPVLIKEEHYTKDLFDIHDCNDEFDNGILKYRAARAENFSFETDAEKVRRVTKALTATLSKFANDELSDLETALTCRAASNYLGLKVHEEASLAAILKSLENVTVVDAQLFIRELPKLLCLPYPVVDELRGVSLQIIERLKDFTRINNNWFYYVNLDYIRDFLEE